MPTFGRKPAGNDSGYGDCGAGNMRASNMGALVSNGWVVLFGVRAGYGGSGSIPTAEIALYAVSGSTLTTRLGVSGPFSVSAIMVDSWSGSNYTKKPAAPIPVSANAPLALALRTQGNYVTHGQDNSGWTMHQRHGVGTSFPSPFGADQVDPQGKMSLWAEIVTNRRPDKPSNLAPVPGGIVAQTLPPMAADFRDADEVLDGFALGQCDKIKAYQFKILNQAKTSVLKDSGKATADGTMQANRRATWTPTGTALAPGVYVGQAIVWDQHDTPSETAEWIFTVNAGGVFAEVAPASGVLIGSSTVTNNPAPNIEARWTHQDGYSTASIEMRVIDQTGAVIRGPWTTSTAVANGAKQTFTWAATGWANLSQNQQAQIQIRGIDTNGGTSPWASTVLFRVNATPGTPVFVSPAAGASSTTRPMLVIQTADANDDSGTLTPEFYVRPSGDAGSGTKVATVAYDAVTGDRWQGYPSTTEMPSVASYEWRARVIDPWGSASGYTAWRAVNYVTPPAVTVTAPVGTITSGSPTITWTVDRAMSSYQAVLSRMSGGGTVIDYDSGLVTSAVGNQPVPPGRLRNLTTYTLTLLVNTSDGLSAVSTTTFTLSYTPPAALTGLTVAPYAGQFEGSDTAEWSLVRVSWTAPSTGTVSDADFGGYLVRRTDNGTGEVELMAHLLTRNETAFIDRRPQSGTNYTYTVTYLKLMNSIEYIESSSASDAITITLRQTVLVSMDEDGLSVPLRFWTSREVQHKRTVEVVETWGEKPVVFQGRGNYAIITGNFRAMDDPEGNYTAMDIAAAVSQMSSVTDDASGRPRPRILCYRDPKRRVLFVSITEGREVDEHIASLEGIPLTLVENATDAWGVAV